MDISKYAGAGQDTIAQQESMPLIKILQDMSDEVKERHENYIEGAKSGLLMFNKDKTLLGDKATIVPLVSKPIYVEWIPRDQGGGMVGHHPLSICADSRYKKGTGKDKYKEYLDTNELLYTVYWMVLLQKDDAWERAVIAMSRTQLRASRKLGELIAKFRYDGQDDITPPTFARKIELSTVLEKDKADNEYFNYSVKPLEVIEDEALMDTAFASVSEAKANLPSPEEQPALAAEEPY